MSVTDSLCCKAETNTTLEINYTPIKINFKKIKKPMAQAHTSYQKLSLPRLELKEDGNAFFHFL